MLTDHFVAGHVSNKLRSSVVEGLTALSESEMASSSTGPLSLHPTTLRVFHAALEVRMAQSDRATAIGRSSYASFFRNIGAGYANWYSENSAQDYHKCWTRPLHSIHVLRSV